jgi:hypothetical protein
MHQMLRTAAYGGGIHTLDTNHFGGLQPLGPLRNFEFDVVALIKRTEAIAIDGAVMDENLLSVVHCDEAVALFWAEPLDNSADHFPPKTSMRETKLTVRCSFRGRMTGHAGRSVCAI